MSTITLRVSASRSTQALVVISPATIATPVLTMVSQATRARLSWARIASSTASEIWSATLSGWPSETDSEVKRVLDIGLISLDSDGKMAANDTRPKRTLHCAGDGGGQGLSAPARAWGRCHRPAANPPSSCRRAPATCRRPGGPVPSMLRLEQRLRQRYPDWFRGRRARLAVPLLRGVAHWSRFDAIDGFLAQSRHLRGFEFVDAALRHLQLRYEADDGAARIPAKGRLLI